VPREKPLRGRKNLTRVIYYYYYDYDYGDEESQLIESSTSPVPKTGIALFRLWREGGVAPPG